MKSKHQGLINGLAIMATSPDEWRPGACTGAIAVIEQQEQQIEALQYYPPLTEQQYIWLQIWDIESNGQLATLLNSGGRASWTVCPHCRVDDFTHVEGCDLIPEI